MENPISVIPALSRVTATPFAMEGGKDTKRINSTVAANPTTIPDAQEAQPSRIANPAKPRAANSAETAIGALEPIQRGIISTAKEAINGMAL